MPRRAAIWTRSGRQGFYATIQGKQVFLGLDRTEAVASFHRLKASGKPVERSRASVAVLVDAYLQHAATEVRATTLANYHWYLSQWVVFAGTRPAATLKPLDVTAWFRTRPKWNPSTRRLATEMVKRWSKWCNDQGYLEARIFAQVRAPRPVSRAAASPKDLEAFLQAVTCPLLRDIATVLLDTGARPGEIRTLTADQIDFAASTAVVVGKTGQRVISVTTRSLATLERLATLYSTGPLFRNRDGRIWSKSQLNYRFRVICKRASVKVIPYHFRHDFYRRASRAGIDSVIIAKQLGHKDLKMLVSIYAHVDTSQTKEAVERAAGDQTKVI
jgi:integrase